MAIKQTSKGNRLDTKSRSDSGRALQRPRVRQVTPQEISNTGDPFFDGGADSASEVEAGEPSSVEKFFSGHVPKNAIKEGVARGELDPRMDGEPIKSTDKQVVLPTMKNVLQSRLGELERTRNTALQNQIMRPDKRDVPTPEVLNKMFSDERSANLQRKITLPHTLPNGGRYAGALGGGRFMPQEKVETRTEPVKSPAPRDRMMDEALERENALRKPVEGKSNAEGSKPKSNRQAWHEKQRKERAEAERLQAEKFRNSQ